MPTVPSTASLSPGRIVWGAPGWFWFTLTVLVVFAGILIWAYWRAVSPSKLRWLAGALKLVGLAAIALSLLEPMFTAVRPRPGANLFLVVADNSASLQVRDKSGRNPRSDAVRRLLRDESPWLARLGQDFELRRYLVDARLRPTDSFQAMEFDGASSSLAGAVSTIAAQYRGRPVAGVLLLTDGNSTDGEVPANAWKEMPPIYPVILGDGRSDRDVRVGQVSVTQTNFESLPVTVQAEIVSHGMEGEELVVQMLDGSNREIQRHTLTATADDKPIVHRFQFRPEKPGLVFYQVRAFPASEESAMQTGEGSREATLANNSRLAMVDRGVGPYRILYVCGRPNWDIKFLRRALAEDGEIELVMLVRIAKKEPRFSFRGRVGETTNPLFRGFDNQKDQTAEQYDEPVLIRLGTKDKEELKEGFPKSADQLFQYHAVLLDDVEAEFFTRDQVSLIQQFVSQRGGGLMMLGGQDSFGSGGYARTPLGDMLPVYVDRSHSALPPGEFRLAISREGWLQPWVRLRATEQEEEKRLAEMTPFRVWNAATSIKPGASVLMYALPGDSLGNDDKKAAPALITQRFGSGQTAAFMVGDFWRWGMRRESPNDDDHGKAWRQMARWLVSDVPARVDLHVERRTASDMLDLRVTVRDEDYLPLDNAEVALSVETPDGKNLTFAAASSDQKPGEYVAELLPRAAGSYRISVVAKSSDGQEIGRRETGAVHEPLADEFRSLRPNRELMQTFAEKSSGDVIEQDELDEFVSSLPNRKIPVTDPWIYPLWHQWPVLAVAMLCLVGEWGIRRWKGMP